MSKVFFDTNILVYLWDKRYPKKQARSRELVRTEFSHGAPCVSVQVLQEFFTTVTKKLGVAPVRAKEIISDFRTFETVLTDPGDVLSAIDASIDWQISFWDALIITAARKANCAVVYSEDLNGGQRYGSVRVINPFA